MLKTLCIKAYLIIKDTFLLYVSFCSIVRVRIAEKGFCVGSAEADHTNFFYFSKSNSFTTCIAHFLELATQSFNPTPK